MSLLLTRTHLEAAESTSAARGGSELRLGMSTALSGPTANLGLEMQRGVRIGLERANRRAKANQPSFRLLSLDDGYEPARTAPNVRQLILQDEVLALIGNVGTPTGVTAMPIAQENHTLFFAPFTGAEIFRPAQPNRYVINYRASYAEEAEAMVAALIERGGLAPEEIALFTQRDAYGDAGYKAGLAALKRHGLKNERHILHVRYERNTLAVENAVATLLYAPREPRAVILVGTYAPCAKFIRLAHGAGLKALYHNLSFVGSRSLAESLKEVPAEIFVTQVVPHPTDAHLPLVREYLADLERFAPASPPESGSLEGYIAARVLTRAVDTISGLPTREKLIAALEGLGRFDMGLDQPLELSSQEHQASHRVWLAKLVQGQFRPSDWKELGLAAKGKPQP